MKYIIAVLLSIIIFLGIELNNTYNEISKLGSVIDNLKITNEKLKVSNKKLNSKNKALIKKQQKIQTKLAQRRKKVTAANLKKAQRKFASAGAKMIPFLGIALITGATAYDINEYCKEIDEMEKFEYELFGSVELSNYDRTICGIDVEKKLDATETKIKSEYNKTLKTFNKEKDSLQKSIVDYREEVFRYWINYFYN